MNERPLTGTTQRLNWWRFLVEAGWALLVALACMVWASCGPSERKGGATSDLSADAPGDVRTTAAPSASSPLHDSSAASGARLQHLLSTATHRVPIPSGSARAPSRDDERRWPAFERYQRFRWDLALQPQDVPAGTVYDASWMTEEGDPVGRYLIYLPDRVEWWEDWRQDTYSSQELRSAIVRRVFLAAADGTSGFAEADRSGPMPLDRGLRIGVELEDGTLKYP